MKHQWATLTVKRIKLDVVISHAPWRQAIPRLVVFTRSVLAAIPFPPDANGHTLVVAYIDDAAQQQLNRQFRGKDKPTNVLSFPGDVGLEHLGDIALAYETIQREAQAANVPIAAHLAHLLVHGALHLQGYDHEHDTDAAVMMQKEVEILARLDYTDPYAA